MLQLIGCWLFLWKTSHPSPPPKWLLLRRRLWENIQKKSKNQLSKPWWKTNPCFVFWVMFAHFGPYLYKGLFWIIFFSRVFKQILAIETPRNPQFARHREDDDLVILTDETFDDLAVPRLRNGSFVCCVFWFIVSFVLTSSVAKLYLLFLVGFLTKNDYIKPKSLNFFD